MVVKQEYCNKQAIEGSKSKKKHQVEDDDEIRSQGVASNSSCGSKSSVCKIDVNCKAPASTAEIIHKIDHQNVKISPQMTQSSQKQASSQTSSNDNNFNNNNDNDNEHVVVNSNALKRPPSETCAANCYAANVHGQTRAHKTQTGQFVKTCDNLLSERQNSTRAFETTSTTEFTINPLRIDAKSHFEPKLVENSNTNDQQITDPNADDDSDDKSSALSATSSLLSQLLNSSCLSQLIEIDCVDKVRRAKDLKHARKTIQLEQQQQQQQNANYLNVTYKLNTCFPGITNKNSSSSHDKQRTSSNEIDYFIENNEDTNTNKKQDFLVRSKRELGRVDFRRRPILGSKSVATTNLQPSSSSLSKQQATSMRELRNHVGQQQQQPTINYRELGVVRVAGLGAGQFSNLSDFLEAANSSGLPEANLSSNYATNCSNSSLKIPTTNINEQTNLNSRIITATTNHSLLCCCSARSRPDTCCGFCALISNHSLAANGNQQILNSSSSYSQMAKNHDKQQSASSSSCRDLSLEYTSKKRQQAVATSKVKVRADSNLSSMLIRNQQQMQMQQQQQQAQFDSLLEESRDGSESTRSNRSSPPRAGVHANATANQNNSIELIASRLRALKLADESCESSSWSPTNQRLANRCVVSSSSSTSSSPLSSTHLQVTQSSSNSSLDLSIKRKTNSGNKKTLVLHEEYEYSNDCSELGSAKLIVGGKCDLSLQPNCTHFGSISGFVGVASQKTTTTSIDTNLDSVNSKTIITSNKQKTAIPINERDRYQSTEYAKSDCKSQLTDNLASHRLTQLAGLLANCSKNGVNLLNNSKNDEKRIQFELDPTQKSARIATSNGDNDELSSVLNVKATFARVISLDSLNSQAYGKASGAWPLQTEQADGEPIYDLPASVLGLRLSPEQKYPKNRCVEQAHYTTTRTTKSPTKQIIHPLDASNKYRDNLVKLVDARPDNHNYNYNLPQRLLQMQRHYKRHIINDTISRFSRLAMDGSETSGLLSRSGLPRRRSRRRGRSSARHKHNDNGSSRQRRRRRRRRTRSRRRCCSSTSSSSSCCSLCCSLAMSTSISSDDLSRITAPCRYCRERNLTRRRGRHPDTSTSSTSSTSTSTTTTITSISCFQSEDDDDNYEQNGSLTEEYLRRHRPTHKSTASRGAQRSKTRQRRVHQRHIVGRRLGSRSQRRSSGHGNQSKQRATTTTLTCCTRHNQQQEFDGAREPLKTGNEQRHSHVERTSSSNQVASNFEQKHQQIAQQHATNKVEISHDNLNAKSLLMPAANATNNLSNGKNNTQKTTTTAAATADNFRAQVTGDKRVGCSTFEENRSRFEQAANWSTKSRLIDEENTAKIAQDKNPEGDTVIKADTDQAKKIYKTPKSCKIRLQRVPTTSSSLGTIPRSCCRRTSRLTAGRIARGRGKRRQRKHEKSDAPDRPQSSCLSPSKSFEQLNARFGHDFRDCSEKELHNNNHRSVLHNGNKNYLNNHHHHHHHYVTTGSSKKRQHKHKSANRKVSIRRLLKFRRRQQEHERQQFRMQLRNHSRYGVDLDGDVNGQMMIIANNRAPYNNDNNNATLLDDRQDYDNTIRTTRHRHDNHNRQRQILFNGSSNNFNVDDVIVQNNNFAGKKNRAKSPLSNLGCWIAAKTGHSNNNNKQNAFLTSNVYGPQWQITARSQMHQQHLHSQSKAPLKLNSSVNQQQFGWPEKTIAAADNRPATPRLFKLQLTPQCQCSHCRTVQQMVEVDAQMKQKLTALKSQRHKNNIANNQQFVKPQQANFQYL